MLKDFAMESDENKLRRAAHVMAQALAVNLALVTCKDPLRISLTNHLRSSLQQAVQAMAGAVCVPVCLSDLSVCLCLCAHVWILFVRSQVWVVCALQVCMSGVCGCVGAVVCSVAHTRSFLGHVARASHVAPLPIS